MAAHPDARLLGVYIEPTGAHPGRSARNHLRSLAALAGLPRRPRRRGAGRSSGSTRRRGRRVGNVLDRHAPAARAGGGAARRPGDRWCWTSRSTASIPRAFAGCARSCANGRRRADRAAVEPRPDGGRADRRRRGRHPPRPARVRRRDRRADAARRRPRGGGHADARAARTAPCARAGGRVQLQGAAGC